MEDCSAFHVIAWSAAVHGIVILDTFAGCVDRVTIPDSQQTALYSRYVSNVERLATVNIHANS